MTFDWQWLVSADASDIIAAVETESDPLRAVSTLRKLFPQVRPENLAQAVTQATLRKALAERTGLESSTFLLTQSGLEQSTHPVISDFRAGWITERYGKNLHIIDLTCGLGFDAIAFAQHGHRVTAFDIDQTTAEFARHNTQGSLIDVIHGDSTTALLPRDADLIFADPARRSSDNVRSVDGKSLRIFNPEQWSPKWSFLHTFKIPVVAKVAPGIQDDVLGNWSAQWISLNGSLAETMAISDNRAERHAVLLDAHSKSKQIVAGGTKTMVAPLGNYLVIPDPALIRARALDALAIPIQGGLVNEHIAWLTTDDGDAAIALASQVPSPCRVLRILEKLPFNERDVARAMKVHPCSGLTIMTRGVEVNVEQFRKKVLKQTERHAPELVLAIYRSEPRNVALLCERVSGDNLSDGHRGI